MKIKWYQKAIDTRSKILNYVASNFGVKSARSLMSEFIWYQKLIKSNPYAFAEERYLEGRVPPIRSVVVSSLNKLVYYVDENDKTIYILDIWETRRDPQNLIAES